MYRAFTLLIVCALLLGVHGATVQAQEQLMNPAEVVEAVYAAVAEQDLETAAEYLADDIVVTILPAPPGGNSAFVGKEAVLGWYEALIQDNAHSEFSDVQVSGDRYTLKSKSYLDGLPVSPAEFDGAGVVQDGKVMAMSWVMTPDTQAALAAAEAKMAQEALVRQWLYHWDVAFGELEGIDELLSDDFVSHNAPEGDREATVAGVAGFREENPNITFAVDDLVIADGKAFLFNHMEEVPEGAEPGTAGEIASPVFLTVLALKDGKITERWLYVPME